MTLALSPRFGGWSFGVSIVLASLAVTGCGGSTPAPPATSGGSATPAVDAGGSSAAGTSSPSGETGATGGAPKRELKPISLGTGENGSGGGASSGEGAVSNVAEALKPIQIVVGDWRGVTRKAIDGGVKVEEPKWKWDLRTDRKQPALVYDAPTSPYFKSARITFLVDKQQYQLKATDKEDRERVYEGTFSEPVQDVAGDDKRIHRTYKLALKEVDPKDERKTVQIVFAQQQNDRYLMEVYDKRGDGVLLVNTVANQREGTSFALNPDDYGEKKCVVSGGLGTSTVSHNGKTYYVCCSGCRAAFDDDPERWIAKFEAANKK